MRASCFPGMCSSPGPFLAFRIPLATVLTLWEMSAWHYPGIFEFRQKDHGPIEAAISSGCPTSSESGSTPQKNKLCENSLHLTTGSLGTLSHREQELGCKFARPGATSEGGDAGKSQSIFPPRLSSRCQASGLTHSSSCQSTCREERLFLPVHLAMRVS